MPLGYQAAQGSFAWAQRAGKNGNRREAKLYCSGSAVLKTIGGIEVTGKWTNDVP